MKNAFSRLLAVVMICTMLMTMLPASFAEAIATLPAAAGSAAAETGDDPSDAPATPGAPATPLTYEDLGLEMPAESDEVGSDSSYLNPQTIVITADNENNAHTGSPDYDLNEYLFSYDRISPIEVRFDLKKLPVRSAYLAIYSYDCDETNGSLPEYDSIYVNDTKVGVMTGQDRQWNTTLISVPVSALKLGANYITIYTGHKDIYTGEITEISNRWAIEVKWLQLVMDGGSSEDRPEEFNVELTDAYIQYSNITCEADVYINSAVSRRYEIEYSLVDKTSASSPTYLQIIANDSSVITGTTVNDTGKLKFPMNSPSGEYIVQVLLRNYSTGEILAADERFFKYTTNVAPRFDITGLAAALSDDEYTNKDLTMTITALADITAGLSDIHCYVDGSDKGEMTMDSEGNLSKTLPVTENGVYTIEIYYKKDGSRYSVMMYKTVDNIDKEGPVFTFKATNKGTVITKYSDELSGVAKASYAITNSVNAPDASKYVPMPASGTGIYLSDDQYLHCTAVDKVGNSASATFIPVRSIKTNLDKITIGVKQSVKTINVSFNPSNATDKALTWTSKNPRIATVSSDGLITGVKKGETTITVSSSNGKTASFKVKVVAKGKGTTSITLNKKELSIKDGKSKTLKATVKPKKAVDKSVRWYSSNTSIVTVDKNGKVKAVGVGTTYITAYASSGHAAYCKVTVTEAKAKTLEISGKKKMKVGKTQTLKAALTPKKVTNPTLSWTTSDASIATVDKTGKVTGVSAGVVTITASTTDGSKLSDSIEITVQGKLVEEIIITGEKKMKIGETQTLITEILPADADYKVLKWKTSNSKIATVDGYGKITALKKGEVTITAIAQDGSKVKAKIKIKVKK